MIVREITIDILYLQEGAMNNGDSQYLQLIEKQRKWIYGLPESEYLLPLMKLRMTVEEAAFLLKIPHFPHTLERLQQILGMDTEDP